MAESLTEITSEPSNARVDLLTRLMIQSFGGTEGFVAAWSDYHHHAMGQGGFATFRCLSTVVRLMEYCAANEPDAAEMSPEELRAELMKWAGEVIEEHPDVVVAAAEKIGWTVVPPCAEQSTEKPQGEL